MKSNASLLYSLCLVVGDVLALVAAFAAAFFIRGHLYADPVAHPISGSTYLGIFLSLLPFWILVFALLGLYNNSIYEKRFQELGRLLIGSFLGLLFVISSAYAINRTIFPARLVPVYGFILAFVFLLIARNLTRFGRSTLFAYNVGITNLLIIGDTKVARELVGELANNRASGYRVVGLVSNKQSSAQHFAHLQTFSSLDEAIKKLHVNDIHAIVQTELFVASEKNNEILEFAQAKHIAFRFVPGNSELFVGNIAVELFRGAIPVIAVHQTPLIGWGRIVKRILDILVGGLALVVAVPFMLVITLLEKLSDPKAPIFYKETRLTRFNNPVLIYKFRSHKRAWTGMSPEEAFTKMGRPELISKYREGGDQIDNDPRIARLGRVLRATSLDELPQLFSVVKGDLSLVGPRALYAPELEKYSKKNMILAVKSGLTGLAQVTGRRDLSFEERRKLDLYYVQNWSLWLDITILIKTVRVVVRRHGAR